MPMPMEKPVKIVLANRPRLLRELLRHALQRAAGRFQIVDVVQNTEPEGDGVDEGTQAMDAIEVDDATWAIIHPDDRLFFESAESPLSAAHILMLAPTGEDAVALHPSAPSSADGTGAADQATTDSLPVEGAESSPATRSPATRAASFKDITLDQLFQLLSEVGVSQTR